MKKIFIQASLFLWIVLLSCGMSMMLSEAEKNVSGTTMSFMEHFLGLDVMIQIPFFMKVCSFVFFYLMISSGITLCLSGFGENNIVKKLNVYYLACIFIFLFSYFLRLSFGASIRFLFTIASQVFVLVLIFFIAFKQRIRAFCVSVFLCVSLFSFVFIAPFVLRQGFAEMEKAFGKESQYTQRIQSIFEDEGRKKSEHIGELVSEGDRLFWRTEYEKALLNYHDALKDIPKENAFACIGVQGRIARMLYRLGKKKEADMMLDALLEEYPRQVDAWTTAILVWLKEDEKQKAFKAYHESSEKFSWHPLFVYLSLYFMNEKKKYTQVLEVVKMLEMKENEIYGDSYLEAAYALMNLGKKDESVGYLKKYFYAPTGDFFSITPENHDDSLAEKTLLALHLTQSKGGYQGYGWQDKHAFLGWLRASRRHSMREAVAFVDAEIHKNPQNLGILKTAAYFFKQEGNYEKAIEIYKKLLVLNPNGSKNYKQKIQELQQKLQTVK